MLPFFRAFHPHKHQSRSFNPNHRLKLLISSLPLLFPIAAYASPFDSGITSIQTLFTSTIARAASLIAIVIGGYSFAHGDPGAKKTLGGVAAGTGIAVLAVNVLSWLWGA
jgi:type IV secretory pathway VirB2 component (pilin)